AEVAGSSPVVPAIKTRICMVYGDDQIFYAARYRAPRWFGKGADCLDRATESVIHGFSFRKKKTTSRSFRRNVVF
ncbi:MAG: hypothetical protein WAL73_04150, partial [Terracidiphilus sp.]